MDVEDEQEEEQITDIPDWKVVLTEDEKAALQTSPLAGLSSANLLSKTTTNRRQIRRSNTFQKKIPNRTDNCSIQSRKDIDDALLCLFTESYQSFRIVEEPAFRKFVSALNPTYELPSRFTISRILIPAVYEKCKIKLKNKISNDVQTCCLTINSWSSINQESCFAVMIHFLNSKFEPESCLLECSNLEGFDTKENVAQELQRIISNWCIDDTKIGLVISDNCKIGDAITHRLGWEHLNCLAQTFNLVITEGLKIVEITEIITKVRVIVKYFKRCDTANETLLTFQRKSGIQTPLELLKDCTTRWNSTFRMIKRFVELEKAIKNTVADLNTDFFETLILSEWTFLKELVQILSPFESCFSGQKYVTASLVIPLIKGINSVLRKFLKKPFLELSITLLKTLTTSLNERFGDVENNTSLSVCTYLDPRFKHKGFSDEINAETAKATIIASLTEIIARETENRKENDEETINNESEQEREKENPEDLSIWDDLDNDIAATVRPKSSAHSTAAIEVQRYTEFSFAPRQSNPLEWWNENKYMFKYLPLLVRRELCNLATSDSCERLLSKTSSLLSERRSQLSDKNAKMIMFIECNQKLIQ